MNPKFDCKQNVTAKETLTIGALVFADGPASSELWSECGLFPDENILGTKTNQTICNRSKDHVHMAATCLCSIKIVTAGAVFLDQKVAVGHPTALFRP